MKKIIGKNQVIITALAIMIAVAGYLSITQDNADKAAKIANNSMDGVTDDADGAESSGEVAYDITDEITNDVVTDDGYVLSDNGEIIKDDYSEDISVPVDEESAQEEQNTGKQEDNTDEVAANDGTTVPASDNVGEAVLVSSTISSEYFSKAKLSREQTRSKNKEILMELVNSTTTTKEQKEKAVNEVIALTSESKKETAAETMLEAKGYGESIVSIVDGSVDVIVDAKELEEKDMAQIEDIVKRKTDVEASNIVITPVGVQ